MTHLESLIKRFTITHYLVATLLILVCIWDVYGLKVTSWTYYYPFKAITISIYLVIGFLIQKKKLSPIIGFEISCAVLYLYSYIGTTNLHSTYLFSFYEGLAFFCFMYTGTFLRFSILTSFGLVLTMASIQMMPEPSFIRDGESIRDHLQIFTLIMGAGALLVYWFFNRQRELLYQKDQKFASIGRQSAFLLHELKSPLSRFMMSNSEKDNRDAEYILSIVEGVELLITKKENLTFGKLNWEEIGTYLMKEFMPICEHYKIQFQISGFEGHGFGHRSTIKLALKNLIKNAVEAIASEESPGVIKVIRFENIIEVSNNGSVISKDMIDQLFTPFYSKKNSRSNHGIGLHFVDSVVRAHNGSIDVNVENGWNIFRIKLGEIS